MREGGILSFDGKDANMNAIHKASSMSRSASTNVGYLAIGSKKIGYATEGSIHPPLLDDVIEVIHRLVVLQALCATPLSPSESSGQLLGKRLMLA
jgi:hypothetical protein